MGEKIDGDQSSRDEEDQDLINNPNVYQSPPNGDIGRKLKLDQIDNGYCQTPIIDFLHSYALVGSAQLLANRGVPGCVVVMKNYNLLSSDLGSQYSLTY